MVVRGSTKSLFLYLKLNTMAQELLSPEQTEELVRNGSITLASIIDAVIAVNAIEGVNLQQLAQSADFYITSKIDYSDSGRRNGIGF